VLLAAGSLAACGDKAPAEPTEQQTHTTLIPGSNNGFVEARTSQIVSDGSPPSYVFDDFEFEEDGTIGTVGWQGIFCVQTAGSSAPAPTATQFTIKIYLDAAGMPDLGATLHTSTHTLAQSNQVFEREVSNLNCGTASPTEWAFYRYETDLATPVAIEGGAKYWISIQAHTPSYAVYFGWRDGLADNNHSLQLYDGDYTTWNVDRAYSLEP